MILCLEPGMLFAMYLFRPRSRAASRRANILFKDMAAKTRKRKTKWGWGKEWCWCDDWLYQYQNLLDDVIPGFGISELLLHCRSLNTQWSIGQYKSPWSIWWWEAAEGERSHGPHWILTVSTHNKSGSVLVGNVPFFYNCKLRILCFCCQCWAL